jgi:hypothetical protein
MENIIMAFTNYTVIYPIYTTFINGDKITAIIFVLMGLASFFSHLVENHKHGMIGIGFSKYYSYILNRIDVIFCYIVIFRLLYLYCLKNGLDITHLLDNKSKIFYIFISILFLRISEYDKYNKKLKLMYMITHSIWHISIYLHIDFFLKKIIYK